MINVLYDIKSRLSVVSKDCLLSVTAISFDISALEIFLPLIVGAKIIISYALIYKTEGEWTATFN